MVSVEDVASVVRSEVAKYVASKFSDTDHFTKDLRLVSDDQTAIALEVEKRLGVRLDRHEYRHISNVSSFAEALHKRLENRRDV